MWYSRYTEGGGDTHDCQKGADMIVESDNRCEFCGKKMLTQIYKESYGEYNMFDFCPDCDGRPGGMAYLKVAWNKGFVRSGVDLPKVQHGT